jgi:thiamine pyrophosphate-dependent acetolactate synthase large subunit-like protein
VKIQEALAILAPHTAGAIRVCSNGFMSRAAFGAGDTDGSFYMIGSMGLASSIGLGIALAQPDRRVVVLDGDGNVLMNMGTLATIAARAPKNLLHVCIDNGLHASTGGQRTISDAVDLGSVARAAGYRRVEQPKDVAALRALAPELARADGPLFVHVRVEPGEGGPPGPRIPHTPTEMTARMRRALGVG